MNDVQSQLELRLLNACKHGDAVIRIIHGQGKHSEYFPVLKSHVRHWLAESDFARERVETVFRGEDGSPYTLPNAGETIVLLKTDSQVRNSPRQLEPDDEEEREARRNAKSLRADRLRTARRRSPRR